MASAQKKILHENICATQKIRSILKLFIVHLIYWKENICLLQMSNSPTPHIRRYP